MENTAPYTKREQDLMNDSVHEKLDRLIDDIKLSRDERHAFEASVKPLFKAVSDNSGDISLLKIAFDENKQANKFINEVISTWKLTKIVVSAVISIMLLFIAVKNLISGGVEEGLLKIKHLIF